MFMKHNNHTCAFMCTCVHIYSAIKYIFSKYITLCPHIIKSCKILTLHEKIFKNLLKSQKENIIKKLLIKEVKELKEYKILISSTKILILKWQNIRYLNTE